MASDPDASAVVFRALAHGARDNIVRMRARVGLTVALSWRSDWPAIAAIGVDPDTIDIGDVLAQQAAVERWAHALSSLPPPVIEVPDYPTTIRLRRSAFGTPVITVRVNGHEHEFWLDTGASLTLVSASVAKDADLKLAALDTLALGVVGGHIPARAVLIDSLAVGPVIARGISAALVSPGTLRLDHRVVNGVTESVSIDGVIGTDVLRALDLVLDAAAGTLTIRKPRPNPLAARNLYWIGYPVVRLVAQDGTPLILGLDTGAEGTYVTPSLLRKLPRTSVAMRRAVIGGLGSEVQRTSWIAREVALSDGDYALTLRNIPITSDRRWTFITFDGVIAASIGAVLGGSGGYWIGRIGGRELLVRHGDFFRLTPERLHRTEVYFARHGASTVFFARFVALLRIFGCLFAGVAEMPFVSFSLVNLAGGVLWAATFSALGYLFGRNLPLLDAYIGRFSLLDSLIVVIAIAAYLIRRRRAVPSS